MPTVMLHCEIVKLASPDTTEGENVQIRHKGTEVRYQSLFKGLN